MQLRETLVRLLAALSLACVACDANVELSIEQRDSSLSWLAVVDSGDYSASWSRASKSFRSALSEEGWIEKVRMARGPLGEVSSRLMRRATAEKNPEGAPDGDYIIVTYDSSFENKAEATETHTLINEPDGAWRTAGYFIK